MDPNLTGRQKEILDYIILFQQEQGYYPSLREIAAHFKLSLGTIQTHFDYLRKKGALSWEKGKNRALKISSFGRSAASWLDDFIQIPILGRVSAGPGLLAEENIEDTLTLPRTFLRYGQGEVFGLKVKGDSMLGAGILEDDTVLVRRQKEAQDREIVVALLGEEATVKYLRREPGRLLLVSANPAYPPREVGEDFQILGKVVRLLRNYM